MHPRTPIYVDVVAYKTVSKHMCAGTETERPSLAREKRTNKGWFNILVASKNLGSLLLQV